MSAKKKDKFTIKRVRVIPKSARSMLKLIDTFLVKHRNDAESRSLWNVLSALRGPDSRDNRSKGVRTVPIRRAAFPKTAARAAADLDHCIPADFSYGDNRYERHIDTNQHFNEHAVAAANVLGLK